MGCAFGDGGCGVYCYVAESPIGLHAGKPWGAWVRAKENAADALRDDLRRLTDPARACVFMSSATDPYQPAEQRLGITRSILEVFVERPIALLVVQTRSPLVERDLELIRRLDFAWLSMTVETDDDAVRRALTPACPSVDRRFRAMRAARARGVRVQAAVSPTLPHNLARFTMALEASADRVVVDTFAGDGAHGARTRRRPLPRRYGELGWGDWTNEDAARRLFERLRERMGADRVGWSQDGFNQLARDAVSKMRARRVSAAKIARVSWR
jgi:DNA repair photolyase